MLVFVKGKSFIFYTTRL